MSIVIVKMSRFWSLIYVTVLLLDNVSGEGEITETDEAPDLMADEKLDFINTDIEKALVNLEDLYVTALKVKESVNVIGADDPENIYDTMVVILDEIIEAVKNSNNAYRFFKAKGLDRIIQQNLKVDHDMLKKRILILLEVLFDVAPTTTTAVIPVTVIDRVLEVFVQDNLALKAHCLDVMTVWLPENPKVQARVMKIGGLAPFYEQVGKLDSSGIKALLDMFNTILKEHLNVLSTAQRSVFDTEKMQFYKKVGLIEHMKTPLVCNGLLSIFKKSWYYGTDESNLIITVLDMLKNIKKYCLNIYHGKDEARKLFVSFRKFVNDPENVEYFESNGLNVTDISEVLEEYVEQLEAVKDEL